MGDAADIDNEYSKRFHAAMDDDFLIRSLLLLSLFGNFLFLLSIDLNLLDRGRKTPRAVWIFGFCLYFVKARLD